MRLRVVAAFLIATAGLAGFAGEAAAQGVSVSPGHVRISVGRPIPSTVRLRWTALGNDNISLAPGGTIQTDEAVPRVVATLPPLPVPPSRIVNETLALPTQAIHALALEGVDRFLVFRTFAFDSGDESGVVALQIMGSLGAEFRVIRVGLRFDEGSPLRLVTRDSRLEAWADVAFAGTGELQAIWEIAEPSSTRSAPVFHPLRRVRRRLPAGQRVSLRTPVLPTDQTGLYLLRLRLLAPASEFEEPALRYYVAEEDVPRDPVAIALGGPAHDATLDDSTAFRWSPVPGAKAYRVEFYDAPPLAPMPHFQLDPEHPAHADVRARTSRQTVYEGAALPGDAPPVPEKAFAPPPFAGNAVAGIWVEAGESEARLGSARRHLERGRTYVWVVRALGEGGIPVGLSPARVIRIPE